MVDKNELFLDETPTTSRLESLSDGIFAIAMTLLVLSINVPDNAVNPLTLPGQLDTFLNKLSSELFFYGLSFIILTSCWLNHNRIFRVIKKMNSVVLWLNIAVLMFAALIPFSTSLVGEYSNLTFAAIIFNLNMFLIGGFFYALLAYASRHSQLFDHEIRSETLTVSCRRSLVFPLIAALALLLSFIIPGWSPMVYLLIPVILALIKK